MGKKHFVWTSDNAEKFFIMRLEHEWLFKKKKQAWKDFFKIVMDSGFSKYITIDQMRKKWQYTVDAYKEAKRSNNKHWLYYDLFDKYLGKNTGLDKFESWSDEWRFKLMEAYKEFYVKNPKEKKKQIMRYVENKLRSENLPVECCVQDMQQLLDYLKVKFRIKYRVKIRNHTVTWPLYDAARSFLETCYPQELAQLEGNHTEDDFKTEQPKASGEGNDTPLTWNQHMTEGFIQFRLQHEWLFKERKQPWHEFVKLMLQNGYRGVNTIYIQKKWQTIYAGYQKAIAENNTKWIYYDIFKLYSEDSVMDPLYNWQEHWVKELIHVRTKKNEMFENAKLQVIGWREVEMQLRTLGIPLDHTLLELENMWEYLKKTYKWKNKFATRGTLNESWPYFEAMERYHSTESKAGVTKLESYEEGPDDTLEDGFDSEDVKPLCFLETTEVEIETRSCRACGARGQLTSLWGQDELARKLAEVADVEVRQSDGLSEHICLSCAEQLERAHRFRSVCRQTDRQQRSALVKVEAGDSDHRDPPSGGDEHDEHAPVAVKIEKIAPKRTKRPVQKSVKPVKREAKPRRKYHYRRYMRVCELCGKNVHNMNEHMAAHRGERVTCDACGKTFKTKSGLYAHMLIHTGKIIATCNVCGKNFRTKGSYQRHYAYHLNERRHCCETCGKGFNSPEILKVHQLVHTGERPYSCTECGKTFRTMGCVGRHKKIVHKIVRKK